MFSKLRSKLNFHPKQIWHNLIIKNWNQKQQSEYWKYHNNEQLLFKYSNNSNWLQIQGPLFYAFALVNKEKSAIKICEIGCNTGNNLKQLLKEGYTNLTGIEIKTEAIPLIPKEITVIHADITKLDFSIDFDIIFTSGVLMHIEDLTFLSKLETRLFVIFESETHKADFIYKRNYKKIFEQIGYKELGFKRMDWNKAYVTRLFRKI